MTYNIISDVPKERLKIISFEGETWRQLMGHSPYLVSSLDRIWYKNTIYYNISLDNFFKYVLHRYEDEDDEE